MHSLDHLEHYTKGWIDHLQEPTESGVSRCPYAKKATHRYRKVHDYHSAYDFWEAVSESVISLMVIMMSYLWLLQRTISI